MEERPVTDEFGALRSTPQMENRTEGKSKMEFVLQVPFFLGRLAVKVVDGDRPPPRRLGELSS
jgi:hypothetical protein